MMDMIFDGLGKVLGLRWVRGDGDRSLARSREAAKGAKGKRPVGDMTRNEAEWFHAERGQSGTGAEKTGFGHDYMIYMI